MRGETFRILWPSLFTLTLFSQHSIECEIGGDITTSSSVIARKFTSYALEFHSYKKELEESSCPLEMASNFTEMVLAATIDRCASATYYPRYLYPKQVSWKRTKGYGQYAKSTNGTYWNSTAAYDARDQGQKEERNYESHEVVSEFLAFALLLPGHPYSRDLYFSIV